MRIFIRKTNRNLRIFKKLLKRNIKLSKKDRRKLKKYTMEIFENKKRHSSNINTAIKVVEELKDKDFLPILEEIALSDDTIKRKVREGMKGETRKKIRKRIKQIKKQKILGKKDIDIKKTNDDPALYEEYYPNRELAKHAIKIIKEHNKNKSR